MARKGIKGITVEIGGNVTPLYKALTGVNQTSRELQGELKGVNALLKLDPTNTELLKQKQLLLKEAIGETEKKLDTLKEAQKQMNAAGADLNDERYRDLQREIIATSQKLDKLKTEQKTFRKLSEEAAEFAKKVGAVANKIPVVNKLTTAFTKTKKKITETVKESETVKKIGTSVEHAKKKVTDLANKVPAINKLGKAFSSAKEKAREIAKGIKPSHESVQKFGKAAQESMKKAEDAMTATLKAAVGLGVAIGGAMLTAGGVAVKFGDDFQKAANGLQASTGATDKEMEALKQSMTDIYNGNFGENFEDIAQSMALVKQQAGDIGAEEIKGMTTNALMLRDTFEMDVTESVRAANMLMKQFSIDSSQAYNLIAQGAQNGLNKNGDLLDSINEYSVHYSQMGLTAEDFFNSLANGTEAGTFSVDKLGDAMKEFGIRTKDTAASTTEGYQLIGLNADEMRKKFAAGGESAKEATEQTLKALFDMDDQVKQNQAGVDLFGTMWEDLGIEGVKALTDLNGNISLSEDALKKISEVKYNSLGEAITGIGRNLQTSILLPIANDILPILNEFANSFKNASNAGEMMNSVTGLIQNILTYITGKVPEFTGFVTQVITAIIQIIPTLSPALVMGAIQLFTGVLTGIRSMFPQLLPLIMEAFTIVSTALTENLPAVLRMGTEILIALINGIGNGFPNLMSQMAGLMSAIVSQIAQDLPLIINSGLRVLVSLITGIVQNIPQLVAAMPQIIDAILGCITRSLPSILQSGIQILNSIISGIVQSIPQLLAALPQIISSIINFIIKNLPQIISTGIQLVFALTSGIVQSIPVLIAALPQIIIGIVNTFKEVNWGDIGSNIIAGITDGIKKATVNLINAAIKAATDTLEAVKKMLGIHSPSRVFRDQVGKQIVAGIEAGIAENTASAVKSMKKLCKNILKTAKQANGNYREVGAAAITSFNAGAEGVIEKSVENVTKLANEQVEKLIKKNGDLKDKYTKAGNDVIAAYREAMQKEMAKAKEEMSERLTEIAEQAQKKYDDIMSMQNSMKSKLSGYGNLYSIDDEGNLNIEDIAKSIDDLEAYNKNLSALKGKISDELMNEITSMSVEDAIKYSNALLKYSDEELKQYNDLYTQKLKKSNEISENFYKGKLEEVQKEYTQKVSEEFAGMQKKLEDAGVNAIEGFIEGMTKTSKKADKEAAKIAKGLVKKVKKELGIKSPSKVFRDEVGAMMAQGLGLGFVDEMEEQAENISNSIPKTFDSYLNSTRQQFSGIPEMTGAGYTQNITINSPKELSPSEVARQTRNATRQMVLQLKMG